MSSCGWTLDEDFRLNSAVLFHGTSNWGAVAAALAPRSDAECRERWQRINGPARLRFRGAAEAEVDDGRPRPPKAPKMRAEEGPGGAAPPAGKADGCRELLDFSKLISSAGAGVDVLGPGDPDRKLDDFLDALGRLCDAVHPTTMDAMVEEVVRRNNHLAAYLRDPFTVKPAYAYARPSPNPNTSPDSASANSSRPPNPQPAGAPPPGPPAQRSSAKPSAGHPQAGPPLPSGLPTPDDARKLNLSQLPAFGSAQPPSLRLSPGPDFSAPSFVLPPPTSPPLVSGAPGVPLLDPAAWSFPPAAPGATRRPAGDGALPLPGPPTLLSPTLPMPTLAMPPLSMAGPPAGPGGLSGPALGHPMAPA
eukprot:EG_transcript_15766